MASLKYVREAKDGRLLSLGITEGEECGRYTVNCEIFTAIGSPSVGQTLSECQMDEIVRYDTLYRARKKALSILSYADNNRQSLMRKLRHAGFSYDLCLRVCEEMVSHGYIREREQLGRLILTEANVKLRGPSRITASLVSKGYSPTDVREVMWGLVEKGEIDFKRNAGLLVEKKLPEAEIEEKKKLLYKNGYKV